jgi:hypothetical protein
MMETVTYVTQSKYFSPAFNAAIFDGPIRIYFSQYQESQALKLYFNFQESFGEVRRQTRGIFKERRRNIFVMLYPTDETFDLSFDGLPDKATAGANVDSTKGVVISRTLGDDFVVGVRGPLEDENFEGICLEMDKIVNQVNKANGPAPEPELQPGL